MNSMWRSVGLAIGILAGITGHYVGLAEGTALALCLGVPALVVAALLDR